MVITVSLWILVCARIGFFDKCVDSKTTGKYSEACHQPAYLLRKHSRECSMPENRQVRQLPSATELGDERWIWG